MTSGTVSQVNGTAVLRYDGPVVRSEADATDLIGNAWYADAELVAVPVELLDDAFFRLGSGLAGAVTQKFVNYRMRLAIVGDLSPHLDSKPLRDFVRESNRGRQLWFTDTWEDLVARLA